MTFAQLLAKLQAMREAFRTVARLRSALSTLGNSLLEILALHHQLGILARSDRRLSVSNSLSGRLWELDKIPAVGDPTHMVQLGTGHRASAGEGQRRVAIQ